MKPVVLNNLPGWRANVRLFALVTGWAGFCASGFGAAPASPWIFHDESFRQIERPGAQPEFLAGGFKGCEGAAWIDEPAVPGGGHLRFGAVHTDVAFRWDEKNGLRGLRAPSFEASAFRPHPEGGLIVAEQTTRRIVRYEVAGGITVLADRFEGKRLNRPNDIAVRRDGSVWFTDPDYLFKQRTHETKELPGQYVFRLVPASGELKAGITDLKLPNGIAFNPEETVLYVGDSGAGSVDRWTVDVEGRLGGRETFIRPRHGAPDGIRATRWEIFGSRVRAQSKCFLPRVACWAR